jgi:excisionase family DNA binding protein
MQHSLRSIASVSRNPKERSVSETTLVQGIVTDWMTGVEAAAYLRIKPRTLLLWVRQGKIRGYPLSGITRHIWRFRKADLDLALVEGEVVLCSIPPSVLAKGEK